MNQSRYNTQQIQNSQGLHKLTVIKIWLVKLLKDIWHSSCNIWDNYFICLGTGHLFFHWERLFW